MIRHWMCTSSIRQRGAWLTLWLFVAGSHLLPLLHFGLCHHQLDAQGEVVHSESPSHLESDGPPPDDAGCGDNGHPESGPRPRPSADHCLVYQAIHQSAESTFSQDISIELLFVERSPHPAPNWVVMPQQELYLLAPATSPPFLC